MASVRDTIDRWLSRLLPIGVGRCVTLFLGTLILVFYLPIVSWVNNLGTWFGCGVGIIVILLSVFYPLLRTLLKTLWRQKISRAVLLILAVGFALFVIWALSLVGMMIKRAFFSPPQKDATVIVLGCKVNGTVPSKALKQRLDAAYEYLSAHPDASCVLSGGQGADEDISEARAMANDLTARGIEADRLYLEEASTDTGENLKYSAELIRREGLSTSVVIVTHSYHQCRAALEAEDQRLIPSAVNAQSTVFSYPTFFLRDLLGVAAKVVFG